MFYFESVCISSVSEDEQEVSFSDNAYPGCLASWHEWEWPIINSQQWCLISIPPFLAFCSVIHLPGHIAGCTVCVLDSVAELSSMCVICIHTCECNIFHLFFLCTILIKVLLHYVALLLLCLFSYVTEWTSFEFPVQLQVLHLQFFK